MIDPAKLVKTIVAAIVAAVLFAPFIPKGSPFASGLGLGLAVYAAVQLINYAVTKTYSINAKKAVAHMLAGLATVYFTLGFISGILAGPLAPLALGVAYFISLVIVDYILGMAGFRTGALLAVAILLAPAALAVTAEAAPIGTHELLPPPPQPPGKVIPLPQPPVPGPEGLEPVLPPPGPVMPPVEPIPR